MLVPLVCVVQMQGAITTSTSSATSHPAPHNSTNGHEAAPSATTQAAAATSPEHARMTSSVATVAATHISKTYESWLSFGYTTSRPATSSDSDRTTNGAHAAKHRSSRAGGSKGRAGKAGKGAAMDPGQPPTLRVPRQLLLFGTHEEAPAGAVFA